MPQQILEDDKMLMLKILSVDILHPISLTFNVEYSTSGPRLVHVAPNVYDSVSTVELLQHVI